MSIWKACPGGDGVIDPALRQVGSDLVPARLEGRGAARRAVHRVADGLESVEGNSDRQEDVLREKMAALEKDQRPQTAEQAEG